MAAGARPGRRTRPDVPLLEGPRPPPLRVEQATLTTPEHAALAAADAVTEFDDAVQAGDLDTLRTLIKLILPNLTLLPLRHHNDHAPDRVEFD